MNYIGIDLAWTYRNETGICVIDENGVIVFCESQRFSDEVIASLVQRYSTSGAVVAIDAPLIVANGTGSRHCDRNLMKEKIHGRNLSIFNCSREYLHRTYGVIRGEEVTKSIQNTIPEFVLTTKPKAQKHSIIEVFPTGIVLGLFSEEYPLKYKIKSKIHFSKTKSEMARMLAALRRLTKFNPPVINVSNYFSPDTDLDSLSKSAFKSFEDKVDAFLCAYAAYWLSTKEGKTFGDEKNGFIVLPVEETVGTWPLVEPIYKPQLQPDQSNNQSSDLIQMLEAIRQILLQNGLEIGTESQSTMLYRMNLMKDKLDEISQCLVKGTENLAEQHADLLILLLGNCLTMDIDITKAFWKKYQEIMNRILQQQK